MAHIQINQTSEHGPLKVVIDGVDMSDHVYIEGFALVRVGTGIEQCWGVQMIVVADSLDLDLPSAVLQAVAKSDEEVADMEASA